MYIKLKRSGTFTSHASEYIYTHVSIASFFSYSIIMYYDIKLLHIKSSHPNFEVIVNTNRV